MSEMLFSGDAQETVEEHIDQSPHMTSATPARNFDHEIAIAAQQAQLIETLSARQ